MKPKVIAISFSSLTAINRKIYGVLAEQYDLKLVIPVSASLGSSVKIAEPAGEGDPPLLLLPLVRENPRTQYFRGLWKTMKAHKPDYIFLENDPISVLCIVCCVYKLFFGSKILCQTNENLSLSLKQLFSTGGLKKKGLLLFKRATCFFIRPFVDQVFAINYEGKKIFEDLKFKRVSWIPLGYDPRVFYRDENARRIIRNGLKLESATIGYFGRIVPQKGLLLLLRALIEMSGYAWKLLIDDFSSYTTPYIEEIKSFVKEHKLDDQVVFFHANHEEIARYMNACDLVVVPSITEGTFKEQYGRVVQEAIACGCLTITSDSGFLPHFFKEDIFLFGENDVDAIRRKIEQFLGMDDVKRERLLAESMEFIDQLFSIRAQAKVVSDGFQQFK